MLRDRPLRIVAILCLLGLQAPGQGMDPSEVRVGSAPYRPRPQFTLRVDTRLVEVGVVVRDSHGRAIGGLTKDDFEITDEGKKRAVAAFSMETSAPVAPASAPPVNGAAPPATAPPARVSPRHVALLFDDMSMGPGELPQSQLAAKRFVQQGVKKGDYVAIYTTSGLGNLNFTTDVEKLSAAISKLRVNERKPNTGMCPSINGYESYVIANRIDLGTFNAKLGEAASCQNLPVPPQVNSFDGGGGRGGRGASQLIQQVNAQARSIWEQVRYYSQNTMYVVKGLVDAMADMGGERSILFASAGFLSGTLENEMDDIIRNALHAGVVINALDAKGLYVDDPIQVPRGGNMQSVIRAQLNMGASKASQNDALASLAYNTGGLFFHNNNDLDLGFRELGMRPEVKYLLAFTPEGPKDGKYHKLKVRVPNAKNSTVQARQGYMAVERDPEPVVERRIDTLAQTAEVIGEAAATISSVPSKLESGEPALQAVFHLDIGKLRYTTKMGVREQKVTFIAMLLDPEGNFVAGKEGAVTFALKQETFDQMSVKGLNATLTLQAPPGAYKLRAVLQESVEGKVTAVSQPVEIR